MKLFIDCDADTRLARRVKRDTTERGRSIENIIKQYTGWVYTIASSSKLPARPSSFVKPSYDDYCAPTKKYADIVVPRGAENDVAINLIICHIQVSGLVKTFVYYKFHFEGHSEEVWHNEAKWPQVTQWTPWSRAACSNNWSRSKAAPLIDSRLVKPKEWAQWTTIIIILKKKPATSPISTSCKRRQNNNISLLNIDFTLSFLIFITTTTPECRQSSARMLRQCPLSLCVCECPVNFWMNKWIEKNYYYHNYYSCDKYNRHSV